MPTTPTVFLVEDNQSVREPLVGLLRDHGFLVADYASPVEVLEGCDPARPGCLVLDLPLLEMDGLELLEMLKRKGCRQPFLVISGHPAVAQAVESIRKGAVDFLKKPFDCRRFLACVRTAIQHDTQQRRRRAEREAVQARVDSLTPREREVMNLVMQGVLTKQIARQLGMRPKTVEVHRSRIVKKMQVKSVAQLVRLASSQEGRHLDEARG